MIRLRAITEADSALLFRWRNLPEVRRWMFTSHVIEQDEHRRWLESVLAERTRRLWVIESGSSPVGMASLVGVTADASDCSLGFYIGEESARGTGAAVAGLYLTLDHAFKTEGMAAVTAEVFAENVRAVELYRRIGLQETDRRAGPRDDAIVIRMELSAEAWRRNCDRLHHELSERGLVP